MTNPQKTTKFTTDELKACLLKQFKYGRDLEVKFEGSQLVETKREGGVFVKMDFNGAPVLKDSFVEFMDANDSGVIATYADAAKAFDSLKEHDELAHAALYWYVFDRGANKDAEWLMGKLDVSERTVRNLTARGVRFMAEAIMYGIPDVKRPEIAPVYLSA